MALSEASFLKIYNKWIEFLLCSLNKAEDLVNESVVVEHVVAVVEVVAVAAAVFAFLPA